VLPAALERCDAPGASALLKLGPTPFVLCLSAFVVCFAPLVLVAFVSVAPQVKTILRGSDADVVALRNRLVKSAADFVTPSASPDAAAGDAAAAAWATAAAATTTAAAAAVTATGSPDAASTGGAPPPAPPAVDAGVVFHACIVALLDHTLSPAVPTLCGPYARAFEGMVRLVEDAGWQITAPVMKITG